MRDLLMIVPFFPPNAGGGVYRPLGFVRYLGRWGWRPTVVTMAADSYWIKDESLLDEVPPECDVRRTKTLSGQAVLTALRGRGGQRSANVRSSRGFGLMRRAGAAVLLPDTYVGWYPFALGEAERLAREKHFDAVYSTSPPETSHLVARRLSLSTGLPWLADFRDPWMNLYLLPAPTAVHRGIHRRLERLVCSRASVVVSHAWHRDLLAAKFPDMEPPALITNGYDPAHVEPVMGIRPDPDAFQIVHAGMLTQKRSAAPFLEALRIFLDEVPGAARRCRVIFIGPRESANDDACRELGLSPVVSFRDALSHAETLKMERASHILVLIKHSNPVYDGIVPGKLFEYIGLRRPILALVPEGEAKRMISSLDRGETAPQADPAAIAGKIKLMYEKYLGGTLDSDYNLAPVPEFGRDVLAGRLAERLDTLVSGRT